MGSLEEDLRAAEARLGGQVAGKYGLESLLGVGGMGAVYRAHHAYTDRKVALKLLHRDVAQSRLNAERFLREARAPAAIRHPAIVEVLDAGKDEDGSLYLVFELLEGEDLGTAIKRGLGTADLVNVACQVLDGLEAAHQRGFVHRDIKPANVFLARGPGGVQAKLLDFGIARRAASVPPGGGLTQAGAVIGTPYFMSPEQMCGEAVDGRADLWALGVVLFYGLSGQLPFHAQNYVGLLAEMMQQPGPSLRNLITEHPEALIQVVDRALAPKLAQRWQSAREMAAELRERVLPALEPEQATRPIDLPRAGPLVRETEPPTQRANTPAPATPPSKPAAPREEPWMRGLREIERETSALKEKAPPSPRRPKGAKGWFRK